LDPGGGQLDADSGGLHPGGRQIPVCQLAGGNLQSFVPVPFGHLVLAAYVTGAFLVAGVSCLYLWRRRHLEFARASFSIALWMALFLVPLQLVLGDLHGRNTLDDS
jgi:cytochrome bd-type quinol oxidase subunit 1